MALSESALGKFWNSTNDLVEGGVVKAARLAARGVGHTRRGVGHATRFAGRHAGVAFDKTVVRAVNSKIAEKASDAAGDITTTAAVGAAVAGGTGFLIGGPAIAIPMALGGAAVFGGTMAADKAHRSIQRRLKRG